MNRKIIFRGLTPQGEWVYGDLLHMGDITLIGSLNKDTFEYDKTIVISESVGQYIGLKDNNGVGIYEGDIVRYQEIEGYQLKDEGAIIFSNCRWIFKGGSFKIYLTENHNAKINDEWATIECKFTFEVIGNIHETNIEEL